MTDTPSLQEQVKFGMVKFGIRARMMNENSIHVLVIIIVSDCRVASPRAKFTFFKLRSYRQMDREISKKN